MIKRTRRVGAITIGLAVFVFPVTVQATGLGSNASSSLSVTSAVWSLAPVANSSASTPVGAYSVVFANNPRGRIQFYTHKNFGTIGITGGTVSATGIPATRTVTLSTCTVAWNTTTGGSRGNCTGGTQTTIATLSSGAPSSTLATVPTSTGTSSDIKAVLSGSSGTVAISLSVTRAQARAATTTSS